MRFRLLSYTCAALAATLAIPGGQAGAAKKPVVVQKPATVKVPNGWPQYVLIPKLKVKAPVEAIDLSKPTPEHAPYRWGDVAWYKLGPKPGELGRAAIFGHLDSTCCPAVFYHLKNLKKGDMVSVQYKSGKPLEFRVMWEQVYTNAKLPLKFLFGSTREHGINLVTCGGVFHPDGVGYDHKVVVYARLLLPNGKLG